MATAFEGPPQLDLRDREIRKHMDKRIKRDMKELIHLVLESPLRDGEVVEADGEMSMETLSKKNTDVRTRIIMQMSFQASSGDPKSAEFLFKYGGYTPAVEQNVTLNIPQIIDDMTLPYTEIRQIEQPEVAVLEAPKEGEDGDKDVIPGSGQEL